MSRLKHIANIGCWSVILIVSIFATQATAELPPYAYAESQQDSPEKLVVKVLSTSREDVEDGLLVEMQAQVMSIARTASGLSEGDVITIVYGQKNNPDGMVGPGPIPLLREGITSPAFLIFNKNKAVYYPSAGSFSFDDDVTYLLLEPSDLQTVYFDYNSAALSVKEREKLQENAKILKLYNDWVVELSGHTDERGTAEYNLSLGERMADMVKNYLLALGLPNKRLKTISYGEEFPAAAGHTEEAWAKNRRVEFKVVKK